MVVEWRPYSSERATSIDHERTREAVKSFKSGLETFHRQLSPEQAKKDTSEVLSSEDHRSIVLEHPKESTIVPAKFYRRLLLSTDQPLPVEDILRLNRLYHAESRLLEASQDLVISAMLDRPTTSNESTHNFRCSQQTLNAFHKETRRTTDRLTAANEITADFADLPTPAGRSIEHEFAELLEDFFKLCKAPNEAEVEMLSVVCDESVFWIKQWFTERRTQVIWLQADNEVARIKKMKRAIAAFGANAQ